MIQRFRADVLYGQSGSRKTTNVGLSCAYWHRKTGKRGRLISMDGGGFEPIEPLIEAGILEVWSLNDRPHPIESLDLACQGYWPADALDPASKLVAPTPATWERVGFMAFEGLTSGGDVILRELRAKKASLSQDPSYSWMSGATVYSGANMSYYGFVQDRLYDFVMKTHMLPVERVLWTALEGRGEEEGSRIPTFGPAIAGKKSTGKAPQWFGNCLHLEMLVTEEADAKMKQTRLVTKPVMYLRSHADPLTKMAYPAKTRAPYQFAAELPEFLDPPDLGVLYQKLDELKQKAAQQLQAIAAVTTNTK